jgi:hypothetical protein
MSSNNGAAGADGTDGRQVVRQMMSSLLHRITAKLNLHGTRDLLPC